MNFRKSLSLLLVFVLALSFVGCAPKQAVAPEAAPAPAPEATPGAVELTGPMADYFVTTDWLKANKDTVLLVDASVEKAYKANHITGAINITWQMLSNMTPKQSEVGWGVVLGKEELGKKLGSFGIDGTKQVIIYNDPKGLGEEGRVFWMLKIAGIQNVKMLYGGLPAWQTAGGEVTNEATAPTPVEFTIAAYDDTLIATTDYVKANLGKVKLVDTRSPEEFKGETNHGEKTATGDKALGRIPGAVHLHYADLYNVDGTPKSVEEMTKIFEGLGLSKDDEIVTYCTVGIRSGFTAEMLKMCGFSKAKNYNASFSEWAGTGQEIEK